MTTPRSFFMLMGAIAFMGMNYAPLAHADCESTPSGFACDPLCPTAAAGMKYLARNCRCEKNTTTGVCTPSGTCDEYEIGGRRTGGSSACLCDKYDTMAEVEQAGTVGLSE